MAAPAGAPCGVPGKPNTINPMGQFPKPHRKNDYLVEHVSILRRSLRQWTGRDLVSCELSPETAARKVYFASFALVSHTTDPDPVFNYGNATALELFEMTWEAFTALPSRRSAEPLAREERARLLARVARDGYIDDYSGVRIAQSGKRFLIEGATVWNLLDEAGSYCGQAAMFDRWLHLQ